MLHPGGLGGGVPTAPRYHRGGQREDHERRYDHEPSSERPAADSAATVAGEGKTRPRGRERQQAACAGRGGGRRRASSSPIPGLRCRGGARGGRRPRRTQDPDHDRPRQRRPKRRTGCEGRSRCRRPRRPGLRTSRRRNVFAILVVRADRLVAAQSARHGRGARDPGRDEQRESRQCERERTLRRGDQDECQC
jgi:hypothetical protein